MGTEKPPANIPENLKMTHDSYFQETFQIERLARSFLRKKLPKETLAVLDLDNLAIEDRHFTDDIFKETIADVIYRVPIKGTNEHVNFFVVIEHKSHQDFWTIFQLWGYVYMICRREYQAARARGEVNANYRLPPVVAIILHHGESKFQGKTELFDLFLQLPGLEAYLPGLQAILVDLTDIADDDPMLSDPEAPELQVVLMTFKLIFRQDIVKLKDVLWEMKPYSDDPIMRRLIYATWAYLTNSARHLEQHFELFIDTFEEITGERVMSPTMTEIWTAQGRAEGRVEGWTKGKAEGEARGVLRILARQHGRIPESLSERVLAITDVEKLDRLFDLAFDCATLEEFEKHLD